jgi:hypothetical protein
MFGIEHLSGRFETKNNGKGIKDYKKADGEGGSRW